MTLPSATSARSMSIHSGGGAGHWKADRCIEVFASDGDGKLRDDLLRKRAAGVSQATRGHRVRSITFSNKSNEC